MTAEHLAMRLHVVVIAENWRAKRLYWPQSVVQVAHHILYPAIAKDMVTTILNSADHCSDCSVTSIA